MGSLRNFTSGLTFLVVFALVVAGTVALYQGSFTRTVKVTVKSDRAGLTMTSGAAVKVRGVQVGKVAAVRPTADGADIELAINTSKVKFVSSNSTAQILPPTAFGAKYVQLTSPSDQRGEAISDGATIEADAVTVEVNEAFTNLASVLAAAEPAKVNNTVTALSETLEGRGTKLGELVSQVDGYLDELNASLPILEQDLRKSDDVLDIYNRLTPELVNLLENSRTTSQTLTERQRDIDRLLVRVDSFSSNGRDFVRDNDSHLSSLLKTLEPTTRMLSRYSPVLPCTFEGVAINNDLLEVIVGGKKPGINTYTKLQPYDEPYRAPENLPLFARDRGPDCYGLPRMTQEEIQRPNPDLGTGAYPYGERGPNPPGSIAEPDANPRDTFFGSLAGLIPLPTGTTSP